MSPGSAGVLPRNVVGEGLAQCHERGQVGLGDEEVAQDADALLPAVVYRGHDVCDGPALLL